MALKQVGIRFNFYFISNSIIFSFLQFYLIFECHLIQRLHLISSFDQTVNWLLCFQLIYLISFKHYCFWVLTIIFPLKDLFCLWLLLYEFILEVLPFLLLRFYLQFVRFVILFIKLNLIIEFVFAFPIYICDQLNVES